MTEKTTTTKKATKQGAGKGGVVPPKEHQFGQPNGNPRHNGAWKKEDTLRYKWEQMLKMDDAELSLVLADPKASRAEKITANVLLSGDMELKDKLDALMKLATQVYGQPKQQIEQTVLEAPIPLSPRQKRPDLEQ